MFGQRSALYAATVTFTVILSTAAVLFGFRQAAEPRPAGKTLDAFALSGAVAASPRPVATARLAISGPRRLIDPDHAGALAAGGEANLPLPALPAGSTAVLLELSLLNATGPGLVTVRSGVDVVPALRLSAAKAMTSATVVVMLGPQARSLRVRTEGGGRLLVNLVGVFEAAERAAAGRVVSLTPTRVLQLRPDTQGHDADLALNAVPGLPDADSVSAVLLRVAADVGPNGGHVYLGPSVKSLEQKVFWSATAGSDRIRYGLVVVPVRKGALHVQYHAGKELRADVVGYVTGSAAQDSADGLVVPLPYRATDAVRVLASGRTDVAVVPAGGLAGVSPGRVTAALLGLTASSDRPGNVTVTTPGRPVGAPIVSAVPGKPRPALTLTPVRDGTVTVAGESGANVVLTPRVLVLR